MSQLVCDNIDLATRDGPGLLLRGVAPVEWIRRQNIKRFEELIENETEPVKLARLGALLEEERHSLAALLSGEASTPKSAFSFPSVLVQRTLMSADVLALIADSVICTDEEGRILLFNRAAELSFGYSADEVLGEGVEMLLPQRHRAQHARQLRSFASGEGAANRLMGDHREVWGQRKNGEDFPAEATVSRHSVDGKTVLTVVHRDITERKELEEQREVIARELDHRVRNVLSVVSSLVSLSARRAVSVEEFARSLQERLRALAATQTLLWAGKRKNVSLSELLRAELSHYIGADGTNVVIEVEPVALNPTVVQPLALAVHELATNSAKYGALSDPQGRVIVTAEGMSREDEPLLAIEWRETGGPPVKPPSRRGFGTTLIEGIVKRTLQAEVSVDYRPEGLVCRFILPRTKVEQLPTQTESALGGPAAVASW